MKNIKVSNTTVNIKNISIICSWDVYRIMQAILRREYKVAEGKELFWCLALNDARRLLNVELIAMGNYNQEGIRPIDVFTIPLDKKAAGVILVHNHLAGNLEPSEEDEDITDRLIQAGKMLEVPVQDHVIITETSYYSFKESGTLERLQESTKHVPPYMLKEQIEESLKKGIKQGLQKGKQEGEKKKSMEIARTMLSKGYSPDEVKGLTGLDKKTITKLKQNKA